MSEYSNLGPVPQNIDKFKYIIYYQLHPTKLLRKCPQALSDDDFLESYQKICILGPIVKIQ